MSAEEALLLAENVGLSERAIYLKTALWPNADAHADDAPLPRVTREMREAGEGWIYVRVYTSGRVDVFAAVTRYLNGPSAEATVPVGAY